MPLLVSSLGMAATYLAYTLLAALDPAHRLPHQFYILPSIGISVGGQFFVFFQMFFAYTSDISDTRGEDSNTKFTRFIIAEVFSIHSRLSASLAPCFQGSVYFGAVIGSYVAGVMFATCGYIAVFMAATGLILGKHETNKRLHYFHLISL